MTTKDTKEPTTEDVEAKRQELLTALADLPPAPALKGVQPGTRIGEGLKAEYVDYTSAWFEDVEARRKDRDDQGRLVWPQYSMKEIHPVKDEVIKVQGVGYRLIAGRKCFLPDPHYSAWMDSIEQLKRNDIEFAKPDLLREAGVLTPPHRMGVGPIRRDPEGNAL